VLQRGGRGVARFILLLAAASAVLGGCTAIPQPLEAAPAASRAPSQPIAVATVPAAAGFSHPRLPAAATPASLVGLSAADLSAIIGTPRWMRRESPAQVWQYLGATCVLDVFLYEEGGVPTVVHAEARDESALPVTLAECLQRIEAERRIATPAS
jgi:hypothetical protein